MTDRVDRTFESDRLPDGYVAVPVTIYQRLSPLRVCVAVRTDVDPVAGHLVVLRDTPAARVYLACVCDAGNRVRQWAELWVQQPPVERGGPLSTARESLTNQAVDQQWRAVAAQVLGPDVAVQTGWEEVGPCAVFVDPAAGVPVHPVDAAGFPLVLCRDDAVLQRNGLPPYSTSAHRYLFQGNDPTGSAPLVPATPGAPTNDRTQPLTDYLPRDRAVLAVNPTAGPMLLRQYGPFGLTDLIDRLGGSAWAGVPHGRDRLRVGPVPGDGDDAVAFGGWLLLGRHGRRGRFVEAFHLKIRLLLELVEQVRAAVRATQRPLLNLRPESFQVVVGDAATVAAGGMPLPGTGTAPLAVPLTAGNGLPVLWSCHARLADLGNAVALTVPLADTAYFLPAGEGGLSIYQPSRVGQRYAGRGQFQIRRFVGNVAAGAATGAGNATVVEGTFATREHVVAARNDIIWFQLRLPGRVDLYARLEPQDNVQTGELRFRTVGQRFDDATNAALRSAEGVFLPDVPFEIVPLLSSPCDLYSLGVLAVQTLLLGPGGTLAQSLAEVGSLARHLAREYDRSASLPLRIQSIFAAQPALLDALGPNRLIHEPTTRADAFEVLPEELWWDALAVVVGLFPGFGPDSTCADLGDAPEGGLHRVFDPAVAALRSLVGRTRSLLLIDWTSNREIHRLIGRLRRPQPTAGVVPPSVPPPPVPPAGRR